MLTLRTSPTLWYCAADYVLPQGESVPLVLLDAPDPFREEIVEVLNARRRCVASFPCGKLNGGGEGGGESRAWRDRAAGRDDEPRISRTGPE